MKKKCKLISITNPKNWKQKKNRKKKRENNKLCVFFWEHLFRELVHFAIFVDLFLCRSSVRSLESIIVVIIERRNSHSKNNTSSHTRRQTHHKNHQMNSYHCCHHSESVWCIHWLFFFACIGKE